MPKLVMVQKGPRIHRLRQEQSIRICAHASWTGRVDTNISTMALHIFDAGQGRFSRKRTPALID